ncbi:hypothetical protein OGAPHI_001425 [Ogataea philodendri]|uniref:Uncharacterized protein n=1 Tax=Ogataea philodendri TaxID=1378263 RepID=A0A9P8T8A0_9ASCO|nr:uncharacterized protein OGAPHI_001425 [Ogataea philodendri]KAH3669304.1 hypothetical protein OGAPHI_001425 [Ogataea philodendri]
MCIILKIRVTNLFAQTNKLVADTGAKLKVQILDIKSSTIGHGRGRSRFARLAATSCGANIQSQIPDK